MSRRWTTAMAGVLIALLLAPSAGADEGSKVTWSGVYTAWFQSQQDFRFGMADYNDNYAVQMLRFNIGLHATENVSAHTRIDIGQGWWGVDNADRSADRPGGAAGGSGLFDFKDTNYLVHVDQAYGQVKLPDQSLIFRVGRTNYSLGNRMVLDNNLDGVRVGWRDRLHLSYAKVSEGVDGLTDNVIEDGDGNVTADGGDAHLVTLVFNNQARGLSYDVYGAYYGDDSWRDGTSYLPNDLNYFRSRFAPNVTELMVLGLAGQWKDEDRGWSAQGEASYLMGSDDIDQAVIDARQISDINNGDLKGWNLYLKVDKDLTPDFALGGVFGMGSGDDDVTSGDGNVNKLRTSGFFYLTEVWEDSIMPDEEGITPQGLGAPNVRGYRELENTTAFQLNATAKPHPKWTVFASYTFLKATEPIPAWSVNGDGETVVDYDEASDEIGSEFDYRISWAIVPSCTVGVRGGFFFPGDGAGNLINGSATYDDMAYETKGFVTVKF